MRNSLTALVLASLCIPMGLGAQAPEDDAYLDPEAAAMVAGARAGGESTNASIDAYEMTARQRISVGLEALRRDRLLFRREIASRVSWTKTEGRRSEILGARQAIPVAIPGVMAMDSSDLDGGDGDLAIDPTGGWLLRVPNLGDDSADNAPDDTSDDPDDELGSGDIEDTETFIHPLQEGSERHYRFRTGSTTTIRLPDGRDIRLLELQVLPRRAHPRLLSGSFWLDAATNSPVRGVFSLAAPATMNLNIGLGFTSLGLGAGSATIRYLTVEYGYWDNRWWMPRLIAFEGVASMAGVTVPITFEQAFEDYRIYSTQNPWPGFAEPDTTRFIVVSGVRCRDDGEVTVDDAPDDPDADAADDVQDADDDQDDDEVVCREPRTVLVPRDSTRLVDSPYLPPSIYARENWVTGERELNEVAELLGASRWRGFFDRQPRMYWRPIAAELLHFNRVEGLTLGTAAGIDLEPLSAFASAWIGIADRSPSFDAGLSRSRIRGLETVNIYRRIEAFSPEDDPFSFGNSASAFLFGRDDGDYFRVLGASVKSEHEITPEFGIEMRGFAETHSAVEKATDVSIPNWTGDRLFRDNPAADEADQFGAELITRFRYGLDPAGFRLGVDVGARAETGTFEFVRPATSIFSTFPLPGAFLGALEVSAGSSFGSLPVQRLWYIGGNGSVRGIRAVEREIGNAFWTARAEIATDRPAARIVLFGDAGHAGDRSDFAVDPTLVSAGVGASFLDGIIRADVARAVRGGSGWSLQLHLDAPL